MIREMTKMNKKLSTLNGVKKMNRKYHKIKPLTLQ